MDIRRMFSVWTTLGKREKAEKGRLSVRPKKEKEVGALAVSEWGDEIANLLLIFIIEQKKVAKKRKISSTVWKRN